MQAILIFLLLALPACGQAPRETVPVKLGGGYSDADLVWIVYQVDSLNVGRDHEAGEGFLKTIGHEWAYSPERFKSEAQLPLTDPKQPWTERERERICRICLRHEYQAQKLIPPKPVLSPFDSLKARLQTAFSPFPTTETSVGFPWTSEQSP